MVVLAVAICQPNGKPILSRQFIEMSRFRIEGLLDSFAKLLSGGRKQHTFFETEAVRYVYQPLDELYLLVLTNKGSNIVDDLQTLYKLSQVTQRVVGQFHEEAVRRAMFDVIFAFDEVLSMGYSEDVTPEQVMIQLEMESHEEKLHNMIKQSKMLEANELAKRKAKQINQERAEKQRMQRDLERQGYGGMGPGSGYGDGSSFSSEQARMTMGGGGASAMAQAAEQRMQQQQMAQQQQQQQQNQAQQQRKAGKRGMRLGGGGGGGGMVLGGGGGRGGGGGGGGMLDSLAQEEGLDMTATVAAPPAPAPLGGGGGAGSGRGGGVTGAAAARAQVTAPSRPVQTTGVSCDVVETLEVTLADGELSGAASLSGVLKVSFNEEAAGKAMMKVKMDKAAAAAVPGVDWKRLLKPHPQLDKKTFLKEGVIKSKRKGFPVGKSVNAVKWTLPLSDANKEALMPITFSSWVDEEETGRFKVFLEYELAGEPWKSVQRLQVVAPTAGCDVEFDDSSCTGRWNWLSRDNVVTWGADIVEEGADQSGTLEFTCVAGGKPLSVDDFFPISVSFTAERCACPLGVKAAKGAEGPLPVHASKMFSARYEVVG